jgi:hypothetical protein
VEILERNYRLIILLIQFCKYRNELLELVEMMEENISFRKNVLTYSPREPKNAIRQNQETVNIKRDLTQRNKPLGLLHVF